jgi:hypothetical protein
VPLDGALTERSAELLASKSFFKEQLSARFFRGIHA